MNGVQIKWRSEPAAWAAGSALIILTVDWHTELGVAAAVPYFLVIWISSMSERRIDVWVSAIGCSILVVTGFFLSPQGGEVWKIIANRGLALMVIWSTTLLCLKNIIHLSRHRSDTAVIRRADEKFRLAIESAPNAMVMVDNKGKIVLVNSETERLFGYGRDELLGQPIEMLVPGRFRQNHASFRQKFFELPETRPMGAGRDLFGLHKNGAELPVEIGLNPIQMDDDIFVLGGIIDITERKRAEAMLKDQALQLRQQAEDLMRSNSELKQFAYVASHDLQEPLRKVVGFTQFLNKEYAGRLDDRAQEYMDYIVGGATRMQNLIRDLLSYSRVGNRLRLENTDLNAVVKDITEDLEIKILESRAEIACSSLPELVVEPTLIRQLLQNLVDNGLKYRRAVRAKIEIDARKDNGFCRISVKDNGIGIEPQYYDRIFGVFQRLHTGAEYPGNGIGLAICKKIVELHGGKIWLESEAGKGTTFHFTLASDFKKERNVEVP